VLKGGAVASAGIQVYYLATLSHFTPVHRLAEGTLMYLASLALFIVTLNYTRRQRLSEVFSSDLPNHFFKTGPYRYVRHPFYTSYLLSYTAGAWATLHPVVLLQTIAMFVLYSIAANYEESKFHQSGFRSHYAHYCQSVGRFFPKLFSVFRRANKAEK
jgi:protein-S-isoprenylcysteine O-methyltransferase Ste14